MGFIKLDGTLTVIASIYLDINQHVIQESLKKIINFCSASKYPLILGGDLNAHSVLWGSESNKRGEELEDFILENGLEVRNMAKEPTFRCSRGNDFYETSIDVTLTRDLPFNLNDWRVDRNYNGSDHYTILFEVEAVVPITVQKRSYKNCLLYTSPSPRDS